MQYVLALQDLDMEYYSLIEDLINNEAVQRLSRITHHHFTNRLEHSISVSYLSYRLAKRWNCDARATARAALLHDFFHENREEMAKIPGGSHSYLHPRIAVTNAMNITELCDLEKDIILKHMFLVSRCWFPKYKESYIVTMVDKYVAMKEVSQPIASMVRQSVIHTIRKLLPFRA